MTFDVVLLFVPIEPAFVLAVTSDRDLFMDAWIRIVLPVSPWMLLFVVRTVAHLCGQGGAVAIPRRSPNES
jgi:DNA recombination protein RmuC